MMGDVAVESSATNVTPSKSAPFDTIPNIDSLEGTDADGGDEYATLKRLQRHLEYGTFRETQTCYHQVITQSRYIQLQEEYIKDEQR
jgi:26S proteasome regulatory subunit T3